MLAARTRGSGVDYREQMFEDPLFEGISDPWHAFSFHPDEVVNPQHHGE